MVLKYKIGSKVEKLLEKADVSIRDKIQNEGGITFEELVEITKKDDNKDINIMTYMSELIPIYNPVVPVKKSEGYLKLMERLQKEKDEKNYRSLLRNRDDRGGVKENDIGDTMTEGKIGEYKFLNNDKSRNPINEIKTIKHELTTIFNIFLTVVSVGYAIWYWSGNIYKISNNYGLRILLSLFVSILTLIAEVVVFGGYLRKIDDARKVENNLKENKQVLKTILINSNNNNNKNNNNNNSNKNKSRKTRKDK